MDEELVPPFPPGSALFYPHPSHSHIAPAIPLANNLASKGLPITFLMTQLDKQSMGAQLASHPCLRCLGVPNHGISPNDRRTISNPKISQAFADLRNEVEKMIEMMVREEGAPPCCIITDIFVQWMDEVSLKFNIPRVLFWTGGACSFSIFWHIPLLLDRGVLPVKATSRGDLQDGLIDFIPGLPPLKLEDIPGAIRVEDTSNLGFWFLSGSFQKVGDFPRVLINTFEEVQGGVVRGLLPIASVYPVGPLLLLPSMDRISDNDKKCLSWLDNYPPSSVLYIAFGTIHLPSASLVKALAEGLESSQQPFLWVIRHDAMGHSDASEALPEGFVARTKEKGLIVPWAPQKRVLSHPSTGGFLTHCGWNSTMESVYAGVPMITCPQGGEQAINARFIVKEWKIGVKLSVGEDGSVRSVDVEDAVKKVMQEEMRERAKELAQGAKRALSKGGSSDLWLGKFVEEMLNRREELI